MASVIARFAGEPRRDRGRGNDGCPLFFFQDDELGNTFLECRQSVTTICRRDDFITFLTQGSADKFPAKKRVINEQDHGHCSFRLDFFRRLPARLCGLANCFIESRAVGREPSFQRVESIDKHGVKMISGAFPND